MLDLIDDLKNLSPELRKLTIASRVRALPEAIEYWGNKAKEYEELSKKMKSEKWVESGAQPTNCFDSLNNFAKIQIKNAKYYLERLKELQEQEK